jgi:hypothetical protein
MPASPRWEYLTVMRIYSTERAPQNFVDTQLWAETFLIWRPGSRRPVTRTAADTNVHDLFNELGSQGWELIATGVLDSTVVSHSDGWENVTTPVRCRYVFKRPG